MEKSFIGIDISGKTLDICFMSKDCVKYFQIENNVKHIKRFLKNYDSSKAIVAMENTGRYNWGLYEVLANLNFEVYVISPLHLSKSLGLARGKNDKIDALRIAHFTMKNIKELKPWQPTSKSILSLKVLLTERNSRIKEKRKLIAQQKDYTKMKSLGLDKKLMKMSKKEVAFLDDQIKEIEVMIETIFEQDGVLRKQKALIKSVPGAGNVLAWTILAKTEGFSKYQDPRKFACASGVVPFDFQSGSSVFRNPRVSLYADKQMKSILHMAAMAAIRSKNDLADYYKRKVAEGKNKMSILNAIRNKIIHRIFAVIKNQTIYKNSLVIS